MSKWRASFDSSGALVATSVVAKPDSSSVVRGSSIHAARDNTLSVLRVTITTSTTTEFEDDSSQKLRPFRLSDLRTGVTWKFGVRRAKPAAWKPKFWMRELRYSVLPARCREQRSIPGH